MKLVFIAIIIRHKLCIINPFWKKIIFNQKLFPTCRDKFDYLGSAVYLSCFFSIYCFRSTWTNLRRNQLCSLTVEFILVNGLQLLPASTSSDMYVNIIVLTTGMYVNIAPYLGMCVNIVPYFRCASRGWICEVPQDLQFMLIIMCRTHITVTRKRACEK